MAHILLGRVGDVGKGVGAEGTPREDEAIVGIDAAPDADEVAPDDDKADVDDGADENIEVDERAAENLEARSAPFGLCETTLATWPSVNLSVDALPSPPTLSLSTSNLLWIATGGFGFAMASDDICLTFGAMLLTPDGQFPLEALGQDAHGSCPPV